MERQHTPAKPSMVRTTFAMTRGEVIQALWEYVHSRALEMDGSLENGKRSVWIGGHDTNKAWPVTLVIDHEE